MTVGTVKGSGWLLIGGQSAAADYVIHAAGPREPIDSFGYLTTESWAVRALIETGIATLQLDDVTTVEIVASRSDPASGAVHFDVARAPPQS